MTVLITGQVSIQEIAKVLAPLEQRIQSDGPRSPLIRPWTTPVPPLAQSQNIRIAYPSDEEDAGLVIVAWRGPMCTVDNLKLTACAVLMRYLADTSVSPLQREFVEIADPYASQVSFTITENLESLLYFTLENVPMEKIDLVDEKMRGILVNIANGRCFCCFKSNINECVYSISSVYLPRL